MGLHGRVVTPLLARNNRAFVTAEGAVDPVRSLEGAAWHQELVAARPVMTAEWDAFVAQSGELPLMDDTIDEDQGVTGAWRVGVLIPPRGEPIAAFARLFPATMAACRRVPHLRSAVLSVLEPATELPVHSGYNAGVLMYHLGLRCGGESALCVKDTVVPFADGVGVLFDDTADHHAWNRGTTARVTLFLQIERRSRRALVPLNRVVQTLVGLDPRYGEARDRFEARYQALNAGRDLRPPASEAVSGR